MQKLIISGLSGGSGKTIVSLGLTRFFTNNGHVVCPFKKGPDYIDSAWLMQASHKPCYCLDPFFQNEQELFLHFQNVMRKNPQNTLALIEGNRGLFDGKDHLGSCSTAQLARTLDCPVLLTVNCTKMTRTAAALVMGIQHFDPKLNVAGVILNNIGSNRHGSIVRKSIEEYTDIPVLGIIPRQKENPIPERHMGLSLKDFQDKDSILDALAELIREHTDTDSVLAAAADAKTVQENKSACLEISEKYALTAHNAEKNHQKVRIAYLYDEAFWFYYQENFDALEEQGAELVPLSFLSEKSFAEQLRDMGLAESDLDGLYIGGGYPELFAKTISTSPKKAALKSWIENNMPVYAECGGFMLLTKKLHCLENNAYTAYPMTGVFDIETKFLPSPQGLGYTEIKTAGENPYHPKNSVWKGHEFHFSTAINFSENQEFLLELSKGSGMAQKEINGRKTAVDGLLHKNCYASYTHLFAPAVPHFAKNFTALAKQFRQGKKTAESKD